MNIRHSDSRHYTIEKHYPSGQWCKVAFAVSTAEADKIIAQKTRFENGRFRAMPANGRKVA